MPFFLKKTLNNQGQIALWRINESIPYFEKRCQLYPEESESLVKLSHRKRLEWLASRYLLQLIHKSSKPIICVKDEFGKPYLKDSKKYISLSHSNEMTAVISSDNLVGIDIQIMVPKISRIAKKFINETEFQYLGFSHRLEMMHVIWGAKESLYKAYGRRSLDFRQDMQISKFEFKEEGCSFVGKVEKENIRLEFEIHAQKIDNYILVYAEQQ